MKNNSIKELFALLGEKPVKRGAQPEAAAEPEAEEREAEEREAENSAKPSPEERIGRALLERLGSAKGIPAERLADAIIAAWSKAQPDREPEAEPDEEEAGDIFAAAIGGGKKASDPFEGFPAHTPMPIRSSASANPSIDYEALTDKQFRQLKKQLQRAASEGKRVRL